MHVINFAELLRGRHHKSSSDFESGFADLEKEVSVIAETHDVLPPRKDLQTHRDHSDDTVSLINYYNALFYPEVRLAIFIAVRITLFVAIPLAILARHPNTQHHFPLFVILPLIGIVVSQIYVGEQFAFFIVNTQASVWMMMWGTLCNAWGLVPDTDAWWCALLASIFVVAMFGDIPCKRLCVLYTSIIMMCQELPGGRELDFPARAARDMIMSSGFSLLQSIIFPLTVTNKADELLASGHSGIGKMLRGAATACWSEDQVKATVALAAISNDSFRTITSALPRLLMLISYEFWESTLRLALRRERLALLTQKLPYLFAIADTAGELVTMELFMRQPTPHETIEAMAMESHSPMENRDVETAEEQRLLAEARRLERLRLAKGLVLGPLENFLDAMDGVLDGINRYLNPEDVAEHVPFDALRDATVALQSALDKMHLEILVKSDNPREVNPFTYTKLIFVHLGFIRVANELIEYGEKMRDFDRSQYPSVTSAMMNFFVLGYWNSFWEELPKRLTLATPRDVRLLKDAIKLACGYTIGVVFTLYTDSDDPYYFGMAVLMACGLPTAGDTMITSVFRTVGMLTACSVGYIAVWHTNNLTQQLAIALSGAFIALLFRDRHPYSHAAINHAMVSIPALANAQRKPMLVARIVSNTFTLMIYYAICVLVFPIDVLKVTFNTETAALARITDRFSNLVALMCSDRGERALEGSEPVGEDTITRQLAMYKGERQAVWGCVLQFSEWARKAVDEPTARGLPYPHAEQEEVHRCLRRLAAASDIIIFALSVLHRQGCGPHHRAQAALATIASVVQKIDAQLRLVVQSFMDAISNPYEWSLEESAFYFSRLVALGSELRIASAVAHVRNVEMLRTEFHENVLNRTFAAAGQRRGSSALTTVRPSTREEGDVSVRSPRSLVENDPALESFERMAEIEESKSFVLRRNITLHMQPGDYTVNDDANMVISVVVATETTLHEIEKLLKVMSVLNRYTRSHSRPWKTNNH